MNVETICTYQRKGLLSGPQKPYGSIRRDGDTDATQVRFVKSAQRLDSSLDERGGLLMLDGGRHCDKTRLLAGQKRVDAGSKLADLLRIESVHPTVTTGCRTSCGKLLGPLIAAPRERPLVTRSEGPRKVRRARACVSWMLGKFPSSSVGTPLL